MSTALVPISGLPPETLSQIFMIVAEPFDGTRSFYSSFKRHPLVAIASVCARWRKIAITTPLLWSHIHMDEHFVSKQLSTNAHRWIKLWLERSDGAPLSLRFEREESGRPDVDQTASFLQPHISKVTSLVFHKSSDKLVHAIFSLDGTFSPSTPLKTLSMTNIRATEPTMPKFTWPVENLRGLRRLALCGLPNTFIPNFGELAQMLLNNSDLHTLRIQQYGPNLLHDSSFHKASLRSLKLLELYYDSHMALGQLLSLLEPGTDELDMVLQLPPSIDSKCFQEIRAFFERANIARLALIDLRSDYVTQLSTYLDSSPHLQVLFLDCAPNTNWVTLDALTTTSNGPRAPAGYGHLGSTSVSCFRPPPAVKSPSLVSDEGSKIRARCSSLENPSISNMTLDFEGQAKLKQIIMVHQLSRVVFGPGMMVHVGPSGTSDSEGFLDWMRQWVPVFRHLG
ncbi:hypothetical protein FRC12_000727 [Ceratobasidium sp. 428]|nr:hypothetical protein FRC12_000727 [Ceratobasidium sp. 428]